jgi:hypothetical protein
MTSQDFDLDLQRRLRVYAAVAAAEPTPDEVERAVLARSAGPARRFGLATRDVPWLLVAAALLVAATMTALVVGRLVERRTPILDPAGQLSIVAEAIDSGMTSAWDPADGRWDPLLIYGRGPISPDGGWALDYDARHPQLDYVLRPVTGASGAPRTVWGGMPLAGDRPVYPTVAWSPRSDWLVRIHDDVVELAPVDPGVEPIRRSRTALPIDAIAWGQAAGTLGRIATLGDDGVLSILDLDEGTEASVTQAAFAGDFVTGVPPALAWSSDGTQLAVVGTDGNVWLIDATTSASPVVRRLSSGGEIAGAALWGWSADGTRIGVGSETFDALTGAVADVPSVGPSGCSSLPAWGPTGDLAVVSDGRLTVSRGDGSATTVVAALCAATETVRRVPLDWSPDGRWIVAAIARENAEHWPEGIRIVAVELATGRSTEIVSDDRAGMNYVVEWRGEP